MLFCKNCGSKVEDNDRFCVLCSARLDLPGAVLTKHEYSLEKARANADFDPDSVIGETNLSGTNVLGCQLADKIAEVSGEDYYHVNYNVQGEPIDAVIRHIMLPAAGERDIYALYHRMNYDMADEAAKQLSAGICGEVKEYQARCAAVGINCVHYTSQTLYSEIYNRHHVFIMMKNVVPLHTYLATNTLTMRDALRIGISICTKIMEMRARRIDYGSFSELSLFIDSQNQIFFDAHISAKYEEFLPFSTRSQYNKMFISPMGDMLEEYSTAMLLYRILSGGNSPYLSPYLPAVTVADLYRAEDLRRAAAQPLRLENADNMAGAKVIEALTGGSHRPNIEEIHGVLNNAFNYLTSQELDRIVYSHTARNGL